MLVLTRKLGEAIQIGDDVSVEVLEVRGNRVRLGITAPNAVSVNRSELLVTLSADFSSSPATTCSPGVRLTQPAY